MQRGKWRRNENAVCSLGEAEPTNRNTWAAEHELASNLSVFPKKTEQNNKTQQTTIPFTGQWCLKERWKSLRKRTGSEGSMLLASVHAVGQVPYGWAYKHKGGIHHCSASLSHNHTHWAMTHYTLPQHASQQVNASCTETSTKGFSGLWISPSRLFTCKYHNPSNYWIDWYHWRHTCIQKFWLVHTMV